MSPKNIILNIDHNKNEDTYVIVKDEVIVVNEVISFDNPFDNFDQYMVDELFYETSY